MNPFARLAAVSSLTLTLTLALAATAHAQTTYTVTTTADTGAGSLRAAIDAVNAGSSYTSIVFDAALAGQTISLTSSFNPYSLLRPASGTLTIDGSGASGLTIDGGGANRPFFVSSGSVALQNLAVANTKATGGGGASGGGGGAGLGGAIFVNSGASVSVQNVTFSATTAAGGSGSGGTYDVKGGGGGMGGAGGTGSYSGGGGGGLGGGGGVGRSSGNTLATGGGGGGGIRSGATTGIGGAGTGDGTAYGTVGSAGGYIGGANGGTGGYAGGATGGGGGGGYTGVFGGGGGLVGTITTPNGGFGGGGGGAGANGGGTAGIGGDGGFGGGGGGGTAGGTGGFGGGGGGGTNSAGGTGGNGGFGGGGGAGATTVGTGGFGGGNGSSSFGGGGLGAGGAVFVMAGGSFTIIDPNIGSASAAGGAAGGTGATAGQAGGAGFFLGGNASINISNGNTLTLPAVADFIGGGANASGGLIKTGAGTLVLAGANSYTGGTTLTTGVLSAAADNQLGGAAGGLVFNGGTLRITGTSFTGTARAVTLGTGGFDIADAGNTFTLAQTLTGAGDLGKDGAGTLRLTGTTAYTGATAVNAGTLQLDNGLGGGGGSVTLGDGSTLLARGTVSRAIAGTGIVTANGAPLVLGDLANASGFNLGGAAGVGGTLNVGGNTVVLFSQSAAVLGLQTNLGSGGILTTINGLQLGNAASLDATKILTTTGAATLQGVFTNNGLVNGPTGGGQWLTMQNAVTGAGSFTGNVMFTGGYSPGNSPSSVTLDNATFGAGNTLTMELGGLTLGTQYDHITFTGTATLAGTLQVTFYDTFTAANLSAGNSFDLFDGTMTGTFATMNLPTLDGGLTWNTTALYSSGVLSVTAVPEPATYAALLGLGALCLAILRRRIIRT